MNNRSDTMRTKCRIVPKPSAGSRKNDGAQHEMAAGAGGTCAADADSDRRRCRSLFLSRFFSAPLPLYLSHLSTAHWTALGSRLFPSLSLPSDLLEQLVPNCLLLTAYFDSSLVCRNTPTCCPQLKVEGAVVESTPRSRRKPGQVQVS